MSIDLHSGTPSLVALSAVEFRRPVELVDACIARIEALDPAVNAIAARTFDRALRLPAAICSVVGFRPSPGLVPMDG